MDALLNGLTTAPASEPATQSMRVLIDRMYLTKRHLPGDVLTDEIREANYRTWQQGGYPDRFSPEGRAIAFYGALLTMCVDRLTADEVRRLDTILQRCVNLVLPAPAPAARQNELKRIWENNA